MSKDSSIVLASHDTDSVGDPDSKDIRNIKKELKRSHGYVVQSELGRGAYGAVFKAIAPASLGFGTVAVKVPWPRDINPRYGMTAPVLREVAALQAMQAHPNVVRLLGVLEDKGQQPVLVLEFLPFTLRALRKETPAPEVPVKHITRQLLDLAAYMHSQNIMHRDLKPQNILVQMPGWHLRVIDFGQARHLHNPCQQYTHEVTTLWYRAPEILLGATVYTEAVDVWSIGAIMAEMAHGHCPWAGSSEIDQLFRIFRVLGTPTEDVWPGVTGLKDFVHAVFPEYPRRKCFKTLFPSLSSEGLHLLLQMLTYAPGNRISAANALTHPYFATAE